MEPARGCCIHDIADPFVRALYFRRDGIQRFDFVTAEGNRYEYAGEQLTCLTCGSTLVRTLLERETRPAPEDDWSEPTAVLSPADRGPLTARRFEPVAARDGFVAPGAAA